jgi:predicted RNA-binding Zn-ribbon protein involved in translation (DUF1610 family)
MASGSEAQVERRVVGLSCPACGGTLDLREGTTVERCPFCDTPLLLNVPGNVACYSAVRRLDGSEAWLAVERWLQSRLEEHPVWKSACPRLPWLFDRARMEEALLVYAPFWVVTGQAAGLLSGKEQELVDYPVVTIHPAYDVSELPMRDILLGHDAVVPLDRDALMRDGMVLKATVPAEKARAAAKQCALGQMPDAAQVGTIDLIGQRQVLLFYPLWVIGYRYWEGTYRAVVDGTEPRLLSGHMSDRLPKLVALVAALGLVASFFGALGFMVAGALARALAPKLVGTDPGGAQQGPGWDAQWEELDKTRMVPLTGVGSEQVAHLAERQMIAEAELPRQHAPQVDPLHRQEKGPLVVALRCPTCGQALSGVDDAAVFYCATCGQAVEYRGGDLCPIQVRFVEAEASGHVPHPFWMVKVRALSPTQGRDEWLPLPSEGPLDIYVPASPLPLSECVAQGTYLTRHQPRLKTATGGDWGTCTISRDDALRLARLIYVALDDGPTRHRRRLVAISIQLIVFLSDELD